MLDHDDTFVTHETAAALLRRQDTIGTTAIPQALNTADADHIEHIHDAIIDVLGIYASHRDAAVRMSTH